MLLYNVSSTLYQKCLYKWEEEDLTLKQTSCLLSHTYIDYLNKAIIPWKDLENDIPTIV